MLRRIVLAATLPVIAAVGLLAPSPRPPAPPVIDVWYGTEQRFGDIGLPQRFVNVLGNVAWHGRRGLRLEYSLNNRRWARVRRGPDLHRLATAGDFNLDIDAAALFDGVNRLVIRARDREGGEARRDVRIHFEPDRRWPLPYAVDFARVAKVTDGVQVVDGWWALVDGGARTVQRGHDRILALGDMRWRDYEVSVEATLHAFTPAEDTPSSYGVSHFGIGLRWKGHHGKAQPSTDWFPIGAAAELTLDRSLKDCRWRILPGDDARPQLARENRGRTIDLGRRYAFKARVTTRPDSTSVYRVKVWPSDEAEPGRWDLEAIDTEPHYREGAVVVVAHHTDVSVWKVAVTPARPE